MTGIELVDVTHRFEPEAADATLHEISLRATPGEITAIAGPNGAGKSTLLRIASGTQPPQAGTAKHDGYSLSELKPRERARRVALVPQTLDHVPATTVRSFVETGRYPWVDRWRGPQQSDQQAVEAAMEITGTSAWAERDLRTLSGGERQRVLIARALAQDTPALLCDEPTASLDPDQQLAVLETIARATTAQQRSTLIVTHDLNLAAQFADKIGLLHRGRLRAFGSPTEVLTEAHLTPVFGPELVVHRIPGTGLPLALPTRKRP